MAATRTFTANFVGRTDNLEKSFKRVSKGSALMSDNLRRATRMAGIGFGALAAAATGTAAVMAKQMIDKAASMEEALSKNQLLLGESSKAVEAFAETSLESFGVTNLAALQATGVFANLGKAMKLSEADSASMATTLTGLAGDLSSLHDVSVEEALTALRAGLIGEAEPLRKFGIFLDAATLKTKALQMGLIKNTKEALTPGIKSQAAYAFILQESTAAMGDFTRTADSATNVSKQLAGQWEELQIVIGTALLPSFTALVTHLVDVVMPAITDFFEDPSWEGGALLAGQAAMNGFVKGFAGFTLALAGAVMSPFGFVLAQVVDLLGPFGEDAGEETGTAFQRGLAAAIEQFGPLNPDWDRGDWETAGTAAGGAFYGAAGAMAPGPGFPPFGGGATPVVPPAGPMAPGPGFPAFPVVPPAGPMVPGPGFPTVPIVPPAGPMAPGPLVPAPAPRGPSLPRRGGGGFTGDPGQRGGTTINITAPAVSGQEVVEAIGKYVDGNGPLPPHWQQGAN